MNKKLFSWKALAGLALLVAMGLTSCKQDNAVTFDENGNYVLPTKPVSPTVSGTTVKAKLPSEITALLASKDIKDKIKANEEVSITIDCSALEVTAADATITIPEVTDAIINLTLAGVPAKKDAALIIKDAALDKVNLTLGVGNYGDIELDLPYTTMTLRGEGTINKLTTTTSTAKTERALVLAGATVKALFAKAGYVLVNGGTVEALAWNSAYKTSIDKNGAYQANVGKNATNFNNSNAVRFKTVKVFSEATTPYLNVSDDNGNPFLDKLILASDATVNIYHYVGIKEIEGELTSDGKVGAKVYFSSNYGDMSLVEKLSNLILDTESKNVSGDNFIWDLKSVSNCTFNVNNVTFTSKASVSKAKFAGKEPKIAYYIPLQGTDASYSFTFDGCEFAKDANINIAGADAKPMLDADGNQVIYTYYEYKVVTTNDDGTTTTTWPRVKTLQEIPEDVRKAGDYYGPYTIKATENAEYNNFTVFEVFKDCKYNDAAMTKDNAATILSNSTPHWAVSKKFKISDVVYRLTQNSTWPYDNILVTTN